MKTGSIRNSTLCGHIAHCVCVAQLPFAMSSIACWDAFDRHAVYAWVLVTAI